MSLILNIFNILQSEKKIIIFELFQLQFVTFFIIFQLFWLFILNGNYAVDLYVARILAGSTGGGMYICLPLFVAEIADQRFANCWIHISHSLFLGKKN